jgi:myosin heavy subunit
VSADDLTVDVLLNKDVQKGEVISIDLPPKLSLSSSSLQSTPTPLQPVEQVEVTRRWETLQEMEEKVEKRHRLIEEEMRDARKKMEEEHEVLMKTMKQAGKERERLRKEEEKVEDIKKELRDKLREVAEMSRRLTMENNKTADDVPSLPSPSQDCHSHYSFVSPPSPDIMR